VTIAERVLRATRSHEDFPTALGYALGFAATHLDRAPPCLFRTVDISGDGQNNDGFPPAAAYEHFPFEGVTVNGLAIGGASRGIEDYYLAEVIHGPGAFVEYARNHEDFEEVMRRKLERELARRDPGRAGGLARHPSFILAKNSRRRPAAAEGSRNGGGRSRRPPQPTGSNAAPTRRPSDNSTL
jgi:hypothetical protein